MKKDNLDELVFSTTSKCSEKPIVSPFITHRAIVFEHYGAACKLRSIVLSLWNGRAYPFPLHAIGGLDCRHFAIAMDFLQHYHAHGENDREFMALARELCELWDRSSSES